MFLDVINAEFFDVKIKTSFPGNRLTAFDPTACLRSSAAWLLLDWRSMPCKHDRVRGPPRDGDDYSSRPS